MLQDIMLNKLHVFPDTPCMDSNSFKMKKKLSERILFTSEAKESLFISPPEIPFILPKYKQF